MMVSARRARVTGIAILAIMFVVGALSGAAAMRVVNADEKPMRVGPQRAHPDLLERLELTPEQRVRIDGILERRRAEMEAFWDQHRPVLRAITDSARAELRAVLTPEQREVEERFMEERQAHQKQRDSRRTPQW
jgi:Spy/CpxP family protein refolding chaperone